MQKDGEKLDKQKKMARNKMNIEKKTMERGMSEQE